MKTILTILISTFFFVIYAQSPEKKIKKLRDDYFIYVYTINKSNKQKDGEYYKIRKVTKDTVIFGYYKSDKKAGIWKFKNAIKGDYIIFNYDSLVFNFLSNNFRNIDTFFVKKDSVYVLDKVDSPPIYLGYESEINELIKNNTLPTMDLIEKNRDRNFSCLFNH